MWADEGNGRAQEELDRRGQLVQQLQAQNAELERTAAALQSAALAADEEAARAVQERDALRGRAAQESAHEAARRERELRETQRELERVRMEREEAERLETARKAVIAEQDKWRQTLIEKEKELARLQRQLAEA